MTLSRASLVSVAVAALAGLPARAHADVAADAAAHAQHAEVLYDLGKFAEAARELEDAYTLEPSPVYLFNLAQAYRMAGDLEHAAFALRRYIDMANADQRAEAQTRLAAIEAELAIAAQKGDAAKDAAAKAAADELARTKTDLAAAQAKLAALEAPKPPGTWRLGIESGTTIIYIVGSHTHSSANHGHLRFMHERHFGSLTVDDGLIFDTIPIPYTGSDGSGSSVVYSQLSFGVDLFGPISAHWFYGGGLAGGICAYSQLKKGNPFSTGGADVSDTGSIIGRAELVIGYHLSSSVDIIGESSFSATPAAEGYNTKLLSGMVLHDVFSLGLHVIL